MFNSDSDNFNADTSSNLDPAFNLYPIDPGDTSTIDPFIPSSSSTYTMEGVMEEAYVKRVGEITPESNDLTGPMRLANEVMAYFRKEGFIDSSVYASLSTESKAYITTSLVTPAGSMP